MKIINFIKPGLFIYECIRFLVLIIILIMQVNNPWISPWVSTMMIFTAPAVLFPLMALFIWLDIEKYRTYLPLFTAGKFVGLFILTGWSIISQQVTIIWNSNGIADFIRLILCGDLFALAAVLIIIRNIRKHEMEEN